jgi:ATP-binding cassette subfamily C protein
MSAPEATPPAIREALGDLKRGAIAAAAIGFFVNILHLALPLYSIQIFDRVISSSSIDTLIALTGLVAVALAFQATLDFLRHRIFTILGGRFSARLGQPVFAAAIETTLRHGAGPAASAMRDLTELRNFIASGAVALPLDLAMTPVMLMVLFLLSPAYGLVGLVGVILLALVAIATEILARRPTASAAATSMRVQLETVAAMRNAEAIAAMGMLPAVARRWRRAQAQSIESLEAGRTTAKALSAAAKGLRLALQIAIVATGAVLVIERMASIGTIVAAGVILARTLTPFEQLIDGWRQWLDALNAFERTRALLQRGATTRSQTPIAIGAGRLSVDRLTYIPQGQDTPLLRSVSFQLEPGEMLGVVGPSGAGKSTLARMLVGLWAPTAGGVHLDGQNVFTHERGSFGEAVGYLPQDPLIFDATVRENVARFRDGDMAAVVAAARVAGVHDLIGGLPQGYETRLSDGGARLSGGQRQRVALARAIYGDPKFLVLDEPNSNLDAEGEAALVDALEVMRRRGATIVVVAQRMSILKRADKLLVLKDGAVAQFGERAAVLATLAPQRPVRAGGVAALPGQIQESAR